MPVLTRAMKQNILDEKNSNSKKEIKTKSKKINKPPPNDDEDDDVDENGNIKGLIDYSYDKKSKYKKSRKSRKSKKDISDIFLSYLFSGMDKTIVVYPKIKQNIEEKHYEEDDDEENIEDEENDEEENNEEENIEEEENDEEDEEEEYTELEEEYLELFDEEYNEDEEFDYFHNLTENKQSSTIKILKDIKSINKSEIPLKFKILNMKMDLYTKSIAVQNIDKMNNMDPSNGEYAKIDKWINGLIKIPFGIYSKLKISTEDTIDDKRNFIKNTKQILDTSIYGHKEAKTHILQVLGQWITNPVSNGNVLALQGPMGNGKTTLVKEGISKAIGRPFAFIALGGTSDSSYFDGHSYTYEGSHWGRIVDILIQSKCMNPIIYFDELDKISETYKGLEIVHFLTHITDQSQNSLYQDNYFPGINLDLSKCLFIFSFNDETKVDKILKDRMYVINTKGFNTKEKIEISNNYLLPELLNIFMFDNKDIIFNNGCIEYIISNYTLKEEGVRNLKRCLETIISKINIYNLSYDKDENNFIDLDYKIDNFSLPINITNNLIDILLKQKSKDTPPLNMYL